MRTFVLVVILFADLTFFAVSVPLLFVLFVFFLFVEGVLSLVGQFGDQCAVVGVAYVELRSDTSDFLLSMI